MKTPFDECIESHPLRDALWFTGSDTSFFKMLGECDSRVRIQPPASETQLEHLRRYTGGTLPSDLEDFLRHSNGLFFDSDRILFTADEMIRETESMRSLGGLHMPLDHFLFIGAKGDGDMFAYGRSKSGEWVDIFWWDHETDSRCVSGTGYPGIFGYIAAHVSWWHTVTPDTAA